MGQGFKLYLSARLIYRAADGSYGIARTEDGCTFLVGADVMGRCAVEDELLLEPTFDPKRRPLAKGGATMPFELWWD